MAPPFDGVGPVPSAVFDSTLTKPYHRGKLKHLKFSKRSVKEKSDLTFSHHINMVSGTVRMAQICGT